MVSMLVCFTRCNDDGVLIDRQYHLFEDCPESQSQSGYSIEMVFDPLFKDFSNRGYTWSAIPYPPELSNASSFTASKCVHS